MRLGLPVLGVLTGLVAGNIIVALFTQDWEACAERSFFQAIALGTLLLVIAPGKAGANETDRI